MLEDALLDLTNRGEIVIDPFLGSGSTLIAAEKTGRVCRGVEFDPLYVDVIVRRYEAVTGNQAVLVETGETFSRWARVGQGKQRRSRAGSSGGPRQYAVLSLAEPEAAPPSSERGCLGRSEVRIPSAPPGSPRKSR
jgi:hypothetical protein